MKTINYMIGTLMLAFVVIGQVAHATGPYIDTIPVQGYIKPATGNTPVPDNPSLHMAFAVFQNSVCIWGTDTTVSLTSGLFSANLSGAGTNLLTAIPNNASGNATGMRSNFAGKTLNSALLTASASGPLLIRVYSIDQINSQNVQYDINLGSVPTAYYADVANGVTNNNVKMAAIDSTIRTSVFTGTSGQLVVTGTAGLIDVNMLPPVSAAAGLTGVTPIANGGTNNGSLGVTAGGVVYADGAKLMTSAAGSAGNFLASSGTGAPTWISAAQLLTNINGAARGPNTDITQITNLTTMLALNQGGTGSNLTAVAGAPVYSGAGGMAIGTVGSAGQVLLSGGAGAPTWSSTIGLASGGTGSSLTAAAGSVPYSTASGLALSSVGSAGNFLASGGTGAPIWMTPATVLTNIGAAAKGSNSDITQISGLTTMLATNQGGTGANLSASSAGSIPYFASGSAMAASAAGTAGNVLLSNATLAPYWVTALTTAQGGTNNGSLSTTLGVVYYGDGVKVNSVSAGLSNQVFIANTGAAPSWATISTLGVALNGANGDITSMTNVSTLDRATAGAMKLGNINTTTVYLGGSATLIQEGGVLLSNLSLGGSATVPLATTLGSTSAGSTTTIQGATFAIGGTGALSMQIGGSATFVNIGGSALTNITVGGAALTNLNLVASSTSGKVKIGANGVGFSSIGSCVTGASTFNSQTGNSTGCAGLPALGASTPVAVSCSGNNTVQVACRQETTATFVHCVQASTFTITQAATFSCMWMVP